MGSNNRVFSRVNGLYENCPQERAQELFDSDNETTVTKPSMVVLIIIAIESSIGQCGEVMSPTITHTTIECLNMVSCNL